MRQFNSPKGAAAPVLLLSLSTAILSACGGSDSGTTATPQASAATLSYSMTLTAPASTAPSDVQPTFHLAQAILDEPEDTDRNEPMSSAARAPRRVTIDPAFAQLSTRRLTPQILEQFRDTGMAPASAMAKGTSMDPMVTPATATIYTPAQIRAAYGLPVLPSTASSLTSAQAAQLGAGQTIYLIDALNDPNVAAELASFNSKFGLPGCTVTPIAVSASLPLKSAPTTGCTFSIVYSTASGGMTATTPAYDSGWASEIALDVEWAHATAPYARIILIEGADSGPSTLVAAVQLANQMGPGVVSQSWGSPEDGTTTYYDPAYSVANMTYLASTGDAGSQVNWPAVSSHVLAVSGTSLTYAGSGPRTETVWSGAGAGVSSFVATPAYQGLAVPGVSGFAYRSVADVTFNADPNTGQYLAVIAKGSTNVTWYGAGGTSVAAPQWAGIIAVANALRAQTALAPIGGAQTTLYGLATQAGSYASAFLDVTQGSDGSCVTCYAGVGYDVPSGLGSPNVASLLTALSNQEVSVAPVVTSATVSGKIAVPLSFAITAAATHSLTYSLSGAPAGMSVNATTGVVTWSAPVSGTYSVIATAKDATTGLTGQGTLSVSIKAAIPPQVANALINGTAKTALTFTTQVTDANVVTYSLSGAPSGMSVSVAGVVSWASPVAGTSAVTVIAHDATTGLSGQGIYTLQIVPQQTAPTMLAGSFKTMVGYAFTVCDGIASTDPITYGLTGAPAGMTIVTTTGCITWNTPTLGTFAFNITGQDSRTGLTGSAAITLTVTPTGPAIAATALSGVAGKPFTGSIAFTDNAGSVLSIYINGAPKGMSFTVSGNTLKAVWSSPVTGNYSLRVQVLDNQGWTGYATIPVTITAH